MNSGIHPSVQSHLKVGDMNMEKLVRHIFKAPKYKHLVEKYYPTEKFIKEELPPPKPRNLLYHPPF